MNLLSGTICKFVHYYNSSFRWLTQLFFNHKRDSPTVPGSDRKLVCKTLICPYRENITGSN